MKPIRRWAWLPLAVGATPVQAHSPVPGIEGFYVGLLHPFSTPAQTLLMVGLALLAGGVGVEKVRWLLGAFLITSFAGLLLGPRIAELDPPMFAMAFACSALAALVPDKLVPLAVVFAGIGGYLIGEVSIPDEGPARDRIITMSGSVIGANLGLLYLFGVSYIIRERYKWAWVEIAFRVIAAWLGAVALLMFALGKVGDPPPS